MGLSRRNVLIGLGGIVAGGGALVGTGAFTTVQAERTVNVETTGDASAFLALEPAPDVASNNEEYANTTGQDTVQINLNVDADTSGGSGLNKNARTVIRDIIQVTNNGTQEVTSLTLAIEDSDGNTFPDTFSFTSDVNNSAEFGNGSDILDGNGLSTGASVEFGMIVDLLDGGSSNGDLPGTGDYSLTISAFTANSSTPTPSN